MNNGSDMNENSFFRGKNLTEGSLLNDRYIVYSFIKESKISRIYKAIDKDTGKFTIIKEMFLEHILNPAEKSSAEEQFQTEADILLNLVHRIY
jgi:serine/threonine protein kinase